MSDLARVLRIRNIYLYNLAFWIFMFLFELIKSYSLIIFFQLDLKDSGLFLWSFSNYLIYWVLSYWVINLFIRTRNKTRWNFILIHLPTGVLFSIIHKLISEVTVVLLHRLFIGFDSVNFGLLLENRRSILYGLPISYFMYWLSIIILLSLDYYRKFMIQHLRSLELENQLNAARLNSLKMQLHPHFLFNAFNTIVMMIRQNENNKAIHMISDLSDMLRLSMNKIPQQFVSLREEIDLVKKYLLIEKERFIDRLEIRWQIDEILLTEEVPSMLLQPIVENAFKHGISKVPGRSILSIMIRKDGGQLLFEVYNSAPSSLHYRTFTQGVGLGFSNTIDRLSRLYQDNFSIQVNEKDQGISVVIRIPLQKNQSLVRENE